MHALTKGKFFLTGIIMILWSESIFSQNPIVLLEFISLDPTARVWKDGKIYVYGSCDESPAYYCSWRYDILASEDRKVEIISDRFPPKEKTTLFLIATICCMLPIAGIKRVNIIFITVWPIIL